MTRRLNIRIKSVVAMLLFLSSQSLFTAVSRAEIRLQTLTGMQFSLAFRPCGDALTPPFRSLLPPDAEEVSISSLYTVESSLQRHRASLALLAPRSVTLPVPIGDIIARNTDHDTQPIPLGSAAWNFPKACIELVSDEHAAPQQLVNRSLVLSASYAATAFGGTCTVWDLTSSLGRGNKVHGTPEEDHNVAVRPAIAIPSPSIVAYRDTPLQTAASRMHRADQFTASVRDSRPPQPESPQPAQVGDAVRPWVMAPNVAAKFRGNGFQLISTDKAAQPMPMTPAVRRPSLRAGGTGFRTP